jgi:putative phosphoesterase
VTRLAVISDTHLPRGQRRLPDRCVELLRRADAILHAGDVSTTGVLAELQALGPPLHAVHGNVDEPAVVAELPAELELEIDGARIAMLHDSGQAAGRMARMRARFPEAGAVVFGHSHIPLHETGPDGLQLFNPGSPTDRRRQPRHTMGLAEVRDGAVRFELVVLD